MDNEIEELEQQENQRALAKKTLQAFTELCDSIPPIGFFSHKKRLSAYISVTSKAQKLLDSGEISENEILFLLSMMNRKKKDFQKASLIAALSLPKLKPEILPPIGFKYANDIRVNMKLSPVDDESSVEI